MSAMVDTNGTLYVNVPHGAGFISSGGWFLKVSHAMEKPPGLPSRPAIHWYRWDSYHKGWVTLNEPVPALILTEYRV